MNPILRNILRVIVGIIPFPALTIVITGLSCSSPNGEETLTAQGLKTPIATGLVVTSLHGSDPIGILGNPSMSPYTSGSYTGPNGGGIPTAYALSVSYPNPFTDSTHIQFALPQSSTVSVWIVRARWFQDPAGDAAFTTGAITSTPGATPVKVFLRNEEKHAGHYRMRWNGVDDHGQPLSPGFYRVYFKGDLFLFWHDVLLYNSLENLPQDLRGLVELRDNS